MLRTDHNPTRIVADSSSTDKPEVFWLGLRTRDTAYFVRGSLLTVPNLYNIPGSLGVSARRAETRPWDLIRFIPAWESEPTSTQSLTFLTLQGKSIAAASVS
jgi:hypothetical protein